MYELFEDKTQIKGVSFQEAGSMGSKFKNLSYLIMHYTAGRGFDSTVEHFRDGANKVSAHFVVGRDGRLVQMVPLNRPAWHAGPDSKWTEPGPPLSKPMGEMDSEELANEVLYRHPTVLSGMNFYALGIEVDNYGPLTKVGSKFKTWFGRVVPSAQVAEVDPKASGAFGKRYWHAYTEQQIQICEDLAVCLVRGLALKDILSHSDVCPGRKTDPGPVFPLKHIRSLVFGREG